MLLNSNHRFFSNISCFVVKPNLKSAIPLGLSYVKFLKKRKKNLKSLRDENLDISKPYAQDSFANMRFSESDRKVLNSAEKQQIESIT